MSDNNNQDDLEKKLAKYAKLKASERKNIKKGESDKKAVKEAKEEVIVKTEKIIPEQKIEDEVEAELEEEEVKQDDASFVLDEDEAKYYVPEEKIETVFHDQNRQETTKKILVDEEEEDSPQEKANYQVESQLISEKIDGLAPMSIAKEMRKSFLEYAMSVIVARALPDARDGLKPVHRRILYGMHELNLIASVPHKKSARIVGDVLGKYHPHGDSSVYEAMVRLSQDFSMRYPMVDGHGNFGSVDGDSAAAMRYTEARMSKIASTMVASIRKDTVNFVPNYDGSEKEPDVLPARIPNLLISGTTGIAVGMATSIPPHNLGEVVDGVIALAQNPEIELEQLMQHVHGPDFPTGGIILGSKGIIDAYKTGRGSFKVRSKTHIEELKNGKTRIVVTEIPFLVNKANMIEKIAHLVKDKAIEGITDLRDETSRHGIRIVIELRKDVVPEVIQNKLFKMSQLQVSFSVNMLALVNKQPQVLNLKRALQVYLDHQIDVVTRRTKYELQKARARAHILEGLKIAVANISQVIKIIRASKSDDEAVKALMHEFKLTQKQSRAIIEMRLGRLTGLAIEKMNNELAELKTFIASLERILRNKNVLLEVIINELNEVKDNFNDQRRTEIDYNLADIEDEDLIPKKDIAITLSQRGYVKRLPLEEYQVQNRGGIGSKGMSTYEDDHVEKIITTNTHTDVLIFTTYGKVYRIRAYQIPELSKQARGIPFVNLISIAKDEKVIALLTVETYEEGNFLFTITKKGIVKKTPIKEYSRINRNGKIALKMREEDMLVNAMIVTNEDQIVIGGSHGRVVRFKATDVRSMGRTATGVKGIDIQDMANVYVVGSSLTKNQEGYILSIGKDGYGKMTAVHEYRRTKRGAKGVKTLDIKKAGDLRFVKVVKGSEDILVITKKGIIIRTSLTQVATTSRATKGVKIISLQPGNSIKSIDLIDVENVQKHVDEAILKTQEVALKDLSEEKTEPEEIINEDE